VFAAPPVIETTIFARLPDALRARANPRQQSGVPRDSFLEGLSNSGARRRIPLTLFLAPQAGRGTRLNFRANLPQD
jgi:hypothetical protein